MTHLQAGILRKWIEEELSKEHSPGIYAYLRGLAIYVEEDSSEGMTSSSHGDTVALQPPPGRRRPRRSE